MSGGGTISTSETRIEALNLQSSAYGVTMAVFYGVCKGSGNLAWYDGFKAIAHTTTQSAGGKGGGVKTQNTTYTYSASVLLGLGEGPVLGVPRIWRGKKLYTGGWDPSQILRTSELYTPPGSGTMAYGLLHSSTFAAMISVRVSGRGAWLIEGIDYTAASTGVVTVLNDAYRGVTLTIIYQYFSGTTTNTALQQLGMSFNTGFISQPTWSYLTSNYAAQALGYSGLANVTGQDYDLGTGAQVENHLFEVQGRYAYALGASTPDVDPSAVVLDLLTNNRFGAGVPASRLDGFNDWSDYCVAAGLLVSPALTEQMAASEMLRSAAELTNSAVVWSAGTLRVIPYADAPQTGHGRTYTPNVTPVYDLTDDDFLNLEEPVKVTRGAVSDAYNHIRVEFLNRDNQYNPEIAEAKDQAHIETYGLRTKPVIQAHWICDPGVARNIVQLILQRSVYVRNTYAFRLPWTKALLEPMDLVTLTDSGLSMSKLPVRLIQADESDDGEIECAAEDFPLGVATAALYPNQAGLGYQADYNASPGSVDAPVFFEAPVERTANGLEVYAAVKGSAALWGGCRAWVSLDGTNYKQVATLYGGARYGRLTGPIASGTLPVSTSGQLISGSAADAAALNTLCYIGGSSPEYFAYQGATLTGPGAYNLTSLLRGAFGTSQAPAHATNDPFVRVDEAIAKSGDLDLTYIGKTIQFKFTSFNVYGAAEESLAAVPAYAYTITGVMAKLPPSAPTGLTAVPEPFGIRISCAKNPEPDVVRYEYRQGAAWASAAVLEPAGGTSYLWQIQTLGSYTVWVAAVDALGNYSTPVSASTSIGSGAVGTFSSAISGVNLNLTWSATAGSFAIAGYEVRFGATWATATVMQFLQTNKYTELVKWGGTRQYWVAVVDVKGNYGTPMSLSVTINPPGAVGGQRADVVDNNALLYWTAPITGDLPVDKYEVRKGVSWVAGTVVGSNGNSTFTAVFEQQAGTYVYWITAYDSAGTSGTPASVTATINQPPDYVLRNSFDSAFAGTKTNMFMEAGKLVGPVNTSQSWATHFTSNSWASPQDQVNAGFPLYIEPSVTSGSYEEVIDYGANLPATIITVTLNAAVLAGTVAATPTISWSLDNVVYTSAAAGVNQVLSPSGFRYVKVHYDFTCTAGANVIVVSGLNVRLANKLKTDSGKGSITTAASGVAVNFNVPFIDADTPIVQPDGTTPLIPVVDFTDVPFPSSFTVYLYNTSGVKVTGTFSWTARGY